MFIDSIKDWPEPDKNGKQLLEISIGDKEVKFVTSKFSSLVGMDESKPFNISFYN